MNWFQDISTQAKILAGFGLMLLIMVATIGMAYHSLSLASESEQGLFDNDFLPALNLVELKADTNRSRAQMLEIMIAPDSAAQHELAQEIRQRTDQINNLISGIANNHDHGPLFRDKFSTLVNTRNAYLELRDKQLDLVFNGQPEKALQLGIGEQQQRFNHIRDLILELGSIKTDQALERLAKSHHDAQTSLMWFIAAGVIAVIVCGAMTLILTQVIATPLKEITGIAERVAAGDTSVQAPDSARKDEVGVLIQSFRRLVKSIGSYATASRRIASGDLATEVQVQSEQDVMGNALADMVKSLREMTREIIDGISVLAASSGEIMASASQVTSSAAETAAAVSQTTATVEEVKQTALVSSQKARGVSDAAQKAVEAGQNGRNAVNESISGMNHIQEQVESIAESIVRLSEQSQTIGEIIATVNDLAEQSNLLAVNASIEAAKAGEHGKGFAVVAQEVKNLAEQSKEATAQVRAILNDIQKATNAAVMATEQGSKAVETGVHQSRQAGEAIRQLAESIDIAAQAAMQIAASSQQQLTGMDQMTLAMENIKQASEQNTTGMRQVETTSQDLHNLGQKLKDLVAQYQV